VRLRRLTSSCDLATMFTRRSVMYSSVLEASPNPRNPEESAREAAERMLSAPISLQLAGSPCRPLFTYGGPVSVETTKFDLESPARRTLREKRSRLLTLGTHITIHIWHTHGYDNA